ncbi:hypothetical protein PG984_013062 [Apiospora sp. TS-2023a]
MPDSDMPSGGEATTPKGAPKNVPKESASAPISAPAPIPKSPKRKRSEDDTKGGEKKKAKKPPQDPPKRKRAAEEDAKAGRPSKRSKPAPAEKPKGKKQKKPTAKAATGANSTPLKSRGAAKAKDTRPPPPTPTKNKMVKKTEEDKEDTDKEDVKIDQKKVKNAPKLSTSAANSNWRNRDPEEKLGDVKIPARNQALRRLAKLKKTLELRFRDLNQMCFNPYEKAFLDKEKREDRRDPEIVEHLDLIEGLFGRRDNEREDLRRRIMAIKDPKTWEAAEKVMRRRKSKKQQQEEAEPDELVQGLVEVLRSIPALEDHVAKCEARVKRDAKRVRADIALEKKGLRKIETRVYEVPLDRFAATRLESVNKSIKKEDLENAKEMLARDEAPDEGPSGEEEEEKSDDNTEKAGPGGKEYEENPEYIQL